MTRLTLHWHLRGIINGPEDPEDKIIGYEEIAGKEFPIREESYEGSYTTGFTQESGDFCGALDVPASRALNAEDTVKFLDSLANDPTVRYQVRYDSAWLLDNHIWPESPKSRGRLGIEREDIDMSEWPKRGSVGPTYLTPSCDNDSCGEAECLADPDILRETGDAVCMACGSKQSIPEY